MPRLTSSTASGLATGLHRFKLIALLIGAFGHLGISCALAECDDCFSFIQGLGPGESGACVDVSFFGFDGTSLTDLGCAESGIASATIDLFQAVPDLSGIFRPEQPVKSSIHVEAEAASGPVAEFTIVHEGSLGMFPLGEAPAANVGDTSRFVSTSSESRAAFQVQKEGGAATVLVDIELVQNFSFVDPVDNSLTGEIITFFLYELSDVGTGSILGELSGSSKFDSATSDIPNFKDPFAAGYDGFTTAKATEPGMANAEFRRTTNHSLPLNTDLKISTLFNPSIFADGFEAGTTSPWSLDHTFAFRVSSPDADVRFILNGSVVVPEGDATPLSITEVSRSGNSLSILFTGPPQVTDWTVMGSTDLQTFPDDRSSSSTITDLGAGNYQAVVNVKGFPDPYFVRLQR